VVRGEGGQGGAPAHASAAPPDRPPPPPPPPPPPSAAQPPPPPASAPPRYLASLRARRIGPPRLCHLCCHGVRWGLRTARLPEAGALRLRRVYSGGPRVQWWAPGAGYPAPQVCTARRRPVRHGCGTLGLFVSARGASWQGERRSGEGVAEVEDAAVHLEAAAARVQYLAPVREAGRLQHAQQRDRHHVA
jgi:hypothetical protein